MIVSAFDALYWKLKNFIMLKIVFSYFYLFHHRLLSEILKNKDLKDKYYGERCFILGNGPSLKAQDLSLLEKEYVFTVNQFMRHPDSKKVKTNFHIWADSNFFHIDEHKPEDLELLHTMTAVVTEDNDPLCFFPIEQKAFVKKFKLDKRLRIRYFGMKLKLHEKYRSDINFTRFIPGTGTVVLIGIFLAMYMGFTEIYLLGCDTTSIVTTIKSAMQSNDDSDYAYALTENEKKRMQNLLNRNRLEDYVLAYYYSLKEFRITKELCDRKGIKLINCSQTTVIDSLPRMRYENVVKQC